MEEISIDNGWADIGKSVLLPYNVQTRVFIHYAQPADEDVFMEILLRWPIAASVHLRTEAKPVEGFFHEKNIKDSVSPCHSTIIYWVTSENYREYGNLLTKLNHSEMKWA